MRSWRLAPAVLLAFHALSAAAAERVVTLSPHLAELTCAAGACAQLVGVVAHSDYPKAVQDLPRVGDAFNLNLEQLLALQPTLVLTWEGGGAIQTASRLRALGLRVERLRIEKLEEVAGALRQVGGWLGTEAKAQAVADEYLRALARLRQRHEGAAPLRVFYQAQAQPLMTVGGASPISEAIRLCGGVNVFAQLPQLAAPVGVEALLAARPALLIYSQESEGPTRALWSRLGTSAKALPQRVAVDGSLLTRATPRMLAGIEQVCAAIEAARSQAPETPDGHHR